MITLVSGGSGSVCSKIAPGSLDQKGIVGINIGDIFFLRNIDALACWFLDNSDELARSMRP